MSKHTFIGQNGKFPRIHNISKLVLQSPATEALSVDADTFRIAGITEWRHPEGNDVFATALISAKIQGELKDIVVAAVHLGNRNKLVTPEQQKADVLINTELGLVAWVWLGRLLLLPLKDHCIYDAEENVLLDFKTAVPGMFVQKGGADNEWKDTASHHVVLLAKTIGTLGVTHLTENYEVDDHGLTIDGQRIGYLDRNWMLTELTEVVHIQQVSKLLTENFAELPVNGEMIIYDTYGGAAIIYTPNRVWLVNGQLAKHLSKPAVEDYTEVTEGTNGEYGLNGWGIGDYTINTLDAKVTFEVEGRTIRKDGHVIAGFESQELLLDTDLKELSAIPLDGLSNVLVTNGERHWLYDLENKLVHRNGALLLDLLENFNINIIPLTSVEKDKDVTEQTQNENVISTTQFAGAQAQIYRIGLEFSWDSSDRVMRGEHDEFLVGLEPHENLLFTTRAELGSFHPEGNFAVVCGDNTYIYDIAHNLVHYASTGHIRGLDEHVELEFEHIGDLRDGIFYDANTGGVSTTETTGVAEAAKVEESTPAVEEIAEDPADPEAEQVTERLSVSIEYFAEGKYATLNQDMFIVDDKTVRLNNIPNVGLHLSVEDKLYHLIDVVPFKELFDHEVGRNILIVKDDGHWLLDLVTGLALESNDNLVDELAELGVIAQWRSETHEELKTSNWDFRGNDPFNHERAAQQQHQTQGFGFDMFMNDNTFVTPTPKSVYAITGALTVGTTGVVSMNPAQPGVWQLVPGRDRIMKTNRSEIRGLLDHPTVHHTNILVNDGQVSYLYDLRSNHVLVTHTNVLMAWLGNSRIQVTFVGQVQRGVFVPPVLADGTYHQQMFGNGQGGWGVGATPGQWGQPAQTLWQSVPAQPKPLDTFGLGDALEDELSSDDIVRAIVNTDLSSGEVKNILAALITKL